MIIRDFEISYSNIEDAIASFLIATSAIPDNEDVVEVSLPVITNKEGLVKVSVNTTKIKR